MLPDWRHVRCLLLVDIAPHPRPLADGGYRSPLGVATTGLAGLSTTDGAPKLYTESVGISDRARARLGRRPNCDAATFYEATAPDEQAQAPRPAARATATPNALLPHEIHLNYERMKELPVHEIKDVN
jgi:hypothetical protein